MSYINFKGLVKDAKLKKGNTVVVVLEITNSELKGQFETLAEMIDCEVLGGLDSQIIRFTKLINAQSKKPLIQYKVDIAKGVVSQVTEEGEQLTADAALGIAPEKVNVKKEDDEIELEVINDFILSGFAPKYEDLPQDFVKITQRLAEGESYIKLAADEEMPTMLFTMALDKYRERVAPSAAAWDEWRKNNPAAGQIPAKDQTEDKASSADSDLNEVEAPQSGEQEANGQTEPSEGNEPQNENTGAEDVLPEWLQGVPSEHLVREEPVESAAEEQTAADAGQQPEEKEITTKEVEAYILLHDPQYDGFSFDFRDLIQKKQEKNMSWMELAKEEGASSSKIQSEYKKFKDLVKEEIRKGNGAA
ncbi:hypothetical protein [Paenibacillus sp. GbtcB18]|uniref:hypothetical protein n=1 Tax=Paenibacillus sp. GbtcB18 TaxID=2824763 RepID=UPI001C2F3AB5|nr:hypothetical protein [Paenibacillus sp. GbtcB18]